MQILAVLSLFVTVSAAAADLSPAAKVFDQQIAMVEREVVSLAEAMPAEKYEFAPKQGAFNGVRTFAQQASHIAAVNHATAAAVLGEPAPDMGKSENGPDSLKSKEDIVKYLKDSYAHAHKAAAALTAENLTGMIPSAFGGRPVARLSMVTVPVWHSFDHYGQMVVYARMNGVVPPASR